MTGVSPIFNPQGAISPQPYIFPQDTLLGRTPSPLDVQHTYNTYNQFPNLNHLQTSNIAPSITSQLQNNFLLTNNNWNLPTIQETNTNNLNADAFNLNEATNMNIMEMPTGLSSVLDLDSQELKQLDTGDLAGFICEGSLSQSLTNNLSINDNKNMMKQEENHENMTDSFTRLTTATIDNICNLNSMYK